MKCSFSQLAVPAVLSLVCFLAFSSQYLFSKIEPSPLNRQEVIVFNVLVALLLISYYRAISTDPGRIPAHWVSELEQEVARKGDPKLRQRWCRRCEAVKPPRAHHCKICKRCIPKMDHHCPWTVNCVSHITFPHFIRFVAYSVVAMSYLEYFLYVRAAIIWSNRHLPSYYGPTALQLVHIFVLIIANSITLFALTILLIRSLWCLVVNTYTIEGWEIERHETLVRRARYLGGYLDGPDGVKVRIVKQEYPYDIGLWHNVVQGMGTANVIAWFWPFSASPSIDTGIDYKTNGFEDPVIGWPPPDPDRMPRIARNFDSKDAFVHTTSQSDEFDIEAFRHRQLEDLKRFNQTESSIRKRQVFHKRYESVSNGDVLETASGSELSGDEGEEAWRNSEGDRLADFGVDEEAEFYDEENIPLAELLKKRRGLKAAETNLSD